MTVPKVTHPRARRSRSIPGPTPAWAEDPKLLPKAPPRALVAAVHELRFFVSGKPIAKARARVIARGVTCRAYTPATTKAWEDAVRWVASVAARRVAWKPTADPCEVEIALRGLHPLSDVDNAAKAVLDALNGLAWDDDRRVWSLLVRRDETLAADGALVIVRRAGELEEGARA